MELADPEIETCYALIALQYLKPWRPTFVMMALASGCPMLEIHSGVLEGGLLCWGQLSKDLRLEKQEMVDWIAAQSGSYLTRSI